MTSYEICERRDSFVIIGLRHIFLVERPSIETGSEELVITALRNNITPDNLSFSIDFPKNIFQFSSIAKYQLSLNINCISNQFFYSINIK